MSKRIPENPKYKHIKSAIDTGEQRRQSIYLASSSVCAYVCVYTLAKSIIQSAA